MDHSVCIVHDPAGPTEIVKEEVEDTWQEAQEYRELNNLEPVCSLVVKEENACEEEQFNLDTPSVLKEQDESISGEKEAKPTENFLFVPVMTEESEECLPEPDPLGCSTNHVENTLSSEAASLTTREAKHTKSDVPKWECAEAFQLHDAGPWRMDSEVKDYPSDGCEEYPVREHPSFRLSQDGARPAGRELCKSVGLGSACISQPVILFDRSSHPEGKLHICCVCHKTFTSKRLLQLHRLAHAAGKRFQCEDCGLAFAGASSLLVHRRTHSGERPFKCDHCNKAFVTSSHLTIHKRIHSGERPYLCDYCGKGFVKSFHLVEHKRRHFGQKPFQCKVCGKKFVTSCELTKHHRTHGKALTPRA